MTKGEFTFKPEEDGRPIVCDGAAIAYLEPHVADSFGHEMSAAANLLEPLKWMLEVAEARNCDPKKRTVNLKFSRLTLNMWQEQARSAIAKATGGAS